MSPVKMNEDLQSQSKLLLQRLKSKQSMLKNMVTKDESETEKGAVLRTNKGSTSKARQKLSASKKTKSNAKNNKEKKEENFLSKQRDYDLTSRKSVMNDVEDDHCDICYPERRFKEDNVTDTPKTARRRIINKNVHVDSKYDDDDLSDKLRNLNFSYSNLNDDPDDNNDYDVLSRQYRHVSDTTNVKTRSDIAGRYSREKSYAEDLQNHEKNLAEVLNLRKESSYPKSILSSIRSKDNSKSGKVSFLNSSTSSSYERSKKLWNKTADDRRLLGYDWIAALMENDPSVMNQSEAFFDDLKEFRRANREECVNRFYVDGPDIHESLQKVEDETVAKALEDTTCRLKSRGLTSITLTSTSDTMNLGRVAAPIHRHHESESHSAQYTDHSADSSPTKDSIRIRIFYKIPFELKSEVKPYTINERLFTVPINNKLLSGDDDEDISPERQGTREDPRFVRVSIPRSTLMSTYQVKPHRRRSFDPTDAVSLSEHCLLGWENSCPSMLPSASNVGITDASEGVKSKLATPPEEDYMHELSQTLAEAEKIASNFDRPFVYPEQSRPKQYSHIDSLKYRNLGIDNSSLSFSRSLNQTANQTGTTSVSQDIKKKTDDLLDTTYSLMYELERLRKEREFSSIGMPGQKAC